MDRPPANAVNRPFGKEMYAALSELRDDVELRCGLITATGERLFSAGWDLREVAPMP